ncbi:MAG: hypothetical protein RTU92_05070 [Candidatus Thorarchaeota archaeon]
MSDSLNTRKLYGVLLLVILLAGSSLFALVLLQENEQGPSIMISGVDITELEVSLQEMLTMNTETSLGSFQNTLGNIRDVGIYRGTLVATLIELVGGMEETDLLEVVASDGYNQKYTYENVFPNSSNQIIQGNMILAYSFNNTQVPKYVDGFRVVFLPEDGYYSNEDAEATTSSEYYQDSAGARCVKNVVLITLIRM